MSISASDRGATGGALARRYAATGECPLSSSPRPLVIMQERGMLGSPFSSFPATAAAKGEMDPGDAAMLAAVNAICERYLALDGARGCTDDRVCGVFPPWVCFLPVVCCLGGVCALAVHSRAKVVRMTGEIGAELSSSHPAWTLCAASHESRVDMSRVESARGRSSNSAPTVRETVVWLEKRLDDDGEGLEKGRAKGAGGYD